MFNGSIWYILTVLTLFLLIIGFLPLIFGARLLVDGASSIATRFNVPNIVIGLTIVAFGTSAPELVVNLIAAINQNSSLVLGNVLGSNIFNILGIIGIAALIYPLKVKSRTTWIEVPLSFLAAAVLLVMAHKQFIDGTPFNNIVRSDGIVLLFFFSIFIAYSFHSISSDSSPETVEVHKLSALRSILYILIGLGLLIVGGRVIVQSAVRLAQRIGLSERIIALTIVSIGTSLPELATSAVAAFKKNVDIAIGNIVGSNIFNIFFILGLSSVVYPVEVTTSSALDLLVHIGTAGLLFAVIFIGKERKVDRWEGAIFIGLYIAYITILLTV